MTAYEYPLNNHWVIWDYETGWVHLTGIWKASLTIDGSNVSPSHLKADIVKLLESTPKEYQQYIKRIRGGFLKFKEPGYHTSCVRFLLDGSVII